MNIKQIIKESINSYVNNMILEETSDDANTAVLVELTEYLRKNPTEIEPGEHDIDYIETENYDISIHYIANTNAKLDYDEGDYYTAPQTEIKNADDFEFEEFVITYTDENDNEGSFELDSDDMYEMASFFEMNYDNYEFDNNDDYYDDRM